MQVPSGFTFTEFDLQIIRQMGEVGFVQYRMNPFRLASGIESHVYVMGREDLTDNPYLELQIGMKIADIVYAHTHDGKQQCLIGVPVAGATLAQAAAMVSCQSQFRQKGVNAICHRVMREQRKTHGAHQYWIQGQPDLDKHRYWFVDNVVTNGDSKVTAAARAEEDGYPSKSMPCLIWIDRQQGAVPRLKAEGFEQVIVAYNLLDITYAFGEFGVWPKSMIASVEGEIKAHQFAPTTG